MVKFDAAADGQVDADADAVDEADVLLGRIAATVGSPDDAVLLAGRGKDRDPDGNGFLRPGAGREPQHRPAEADPGGHEVLGVPGGEQELAVLDRRGGGIHAQPDRLLAHVGDLDLAAQRGARGQTVDDVEPGKRVGPLADGRG
jgi:hypothetical protein